MVGNFWSPVPAITVQDNRMARQFVPVRFNALFRRFCLLYIFKVNADLPMINKPKIKIDMKNIFLNLFSESDFLIL